MRLCLLFSSSALFFLSLSSQSVSSCGSSSPPQTSELHYYQQSAFKSAPAQHQDVFCMLILGDTDPSLLRRSLMLGVPKTAGKTVSARPSKRRRGRSRVTIVLQNTPYYTVRLLYCPRGLHSWAISSMCSQMCPGTVPWSTDFWWRIFKVAN